jgi:cytochrome c oxidase cbb3-type subunit 3
MLRAILVLVCATGAIAQTPPTPVGDPGAGGTLFELHCAVCHGIGATGGRGPGLNRASLAHAPDDAALRRVIAQGIPPEMPASWFLNDADVADVAAYVRSLGRTPASSVPGNPNNGRQVYLQSGCRSCHVIQGVGGGYGVSLSSIGSRRSAAYLMDALVSPAASLPDGFLLVRVSSESGRRILGVRINEDTFSIQLRDAAGRFYSFRKSSLSELQKLRGESPMPPYRELLPPSALQDLVAYLVSLR